MTKHCCLEKELVPYLAKQDVPRTDLINGRSDSVLMMRGRTMKVTAFSVVISTLILLSSTVWATDTQSDERNYVGITVGAVFPNELKTEDIPLHQMSFPGVSLNDGGMLGVRLGHRPKKLSGMISMRIELEALVISGTDIENEVYYLHPIGSRVTLDAHISMIAAMLNVLVEYSPGRIHPYGGIGLGWTWFDMRNAALSMEPGWVWLETGRRTNYAGDFSDDSFGYQLFLGLRGDLTHRLSLDVGYRYLNTKPEVRYADPTDLDVKLTYEVGMFAAGLTYSF